METAEERIISIELAGMKTEGTGRIVNGDLGREKPWSFSFKKKQF